MNQKPTVDVRSLAALARMEMAEDELEKLKHELPAILSFVETIQRVSTQSIDRNPSARNVMREDGEPHESGAYTDTLLAEAPETKDGRLVVKQVVSRKK